MNIGIQTEQPLFADLLKQLTALETTTQSFPAALSVPAGELNVWAWLNSNRGQARLVWSDRHGANVVGGIGVAANVTVDDHGTLNSSIKRCRDFLGRHPKLRFFGGLSFDGNSHWENFGAGRFVLPRLTLDNGYLNLVVLDSNDISKAKNDLEQIRLNGTELDTLPSPQHKTYSPTVDGWQSRIDEALSLIRSEVLEKIVLARKTQLKFPQPVDPISLTSSLNSSTNNCFIFCFNFHETNAFVGATPERLFMRNGVNIQSEVVAGTRRRGLTDAEDERLAIELLMSDKDQREHDIVRKSIRQKLHKFVNELEVDSQASILRLACKQHLLSKVQGELKPEVDDGMLLQRLHPTPAVGGYPTDNALPEIARIEPFNRGWYAAPVGWIGANSAQFAVAIRSAFVESSRVSLFSGAGIVRGSDPAEEWKEVENKIQDYLRILGK